LVPNRDLATHSGREIGIDGAIARESRSREDPNADLADPPGLDPLLLLFLGPPSTNVP
jgi:hypothetical protein